MESLKVVVRVRPFNDREKKMNAKCIINMDLNKTSIVCCPSQTLHSEYKAQSDSKEFLFDA